MRFKFHGILETQTPFGRVPYLPPYITCLYKLVVSYLATYIARVSDRTKYPARTYH